MSTNESKAGLSCAKLIEILREKKMHNEWRWSRYGFTAGNGKVYAAKQLAILFSQHFEGVAEPIGARSIYVIRAVDGVMGFSLDGCGMYTDPDDRRGYEFFIREIPIASHADRLDLGL